MKWLQDNERNLDRYVIKIAIIGGGISGLTTAHLLCGEHEVTLFEANYYPGGHTNTRDITHDGTTYAVDTGFIVFNERTYPNFIKLLDRLDVASQPSVMSFATICETTGLQYCATNLDTLFAQRKNLFSVPFWRMLLEIFRFNRSSGELYGSSDLSLTLGDYLHAHDYSQMFIEKFLIPIGAAVWSADPAQSMSGMLLAISWGAMTPLLVRLAKLFHSFFQSGVKGGTT